MSTERQGDDPQVTHCEWCGAEYEDAERPRRAPTAIAEREAAAGEPATHCEFCGAEYPLPEDPA